MRITLLAVSLALALSGCASQYTGDHSERAQRNTGNGVTWQAMPEQAESVTTLTELVSVPGLSALINEALAGNPGLQQQLISLKTAKAQKRVANASRLPGVSAGLNGTRQQDSDNSYSASLTVSWEADIWQKLGDQVSAAQWAIAASDAELTSVTNTLVAEVMRGYLEVAYYQQLINNEQARLALLKNNQDVILNRYRTGLGALEDLDNARTSSANSEANIAAYQENLAQSLRALAVLLGRTDLTVSDLPVATDFPEVLLPLTSLPEQDLARRPDLMAAYANIQSQEYNTRVAYKSLLPSISLTAALSDTGTSPSQALFTNPVWSLLGQLTAPLFQGGELRANIDIQELAVENSWWGYQSTLLTAVKEVQDGIGQEKSLARQYQAKTDALANAKRSSDTYTQQYRQGLVDILDLLSVYQQTYDLQAQLLQLQFNQLSNRISLGLALGLGVSA
ncbi:TolC family protein [Aestuariibacter sp. GS-14]|uniref:TolC family protein n=1 Tax=Aestuariibacter sp. GS-14 TaxID=2590670 RepID=UPI00112C31C5|nr:TolC family protein [Aestuariibacter sp. GS-14]TPV52884.1 TolC family protein [Aestuariibacter sp. GS-14]